MAEIAEKKSDERDLPTEAGSPSQNTTGNAGSEPYDFFGARDAQATGDMYTPSPEEVKLRNRRSLTMALCIAGFMILVFAITILRIGSAASG